MQDKTNYKNLFVSMVESDVEQVSILEDIQLGIYNDDIMIDYFTDLYRDKVH